MVKKNIRILLIKIIQIINYYKIIMKNKINLKDTNNLKEYKLINRNILNKILKINKF